LAKPIGALSGERRHLTVMFCDLAGSTEMASHLDPEEWRAVVDDYHHAAAQVVERFGGSVAQYLGDGVLAYFGYPEAHDNDAERAVRAGLNILEAIAASNHRSDQPRLAARVGIDSGAVVVGGGNQKEAAVFGDTPNIAARVQAAAVPGTVVITDAVHRLVSGLFVVEDHGAQALKGIERQIQLYRVVKPSGVRGRLQADAASRGLTPFVGREDELCLLKNRWERALESEGQVVLIIGEAGIGKSRLVQRFHEQIAETPHTWIEAGADAFYQNTPFYLVTEVLREFLELRGGESAEKQLERLESALATAELGPAEGVPLISPLLAMAVPARYPPSVLSPEQQRSSLLGKLLGWIRARARIQPLVIAIEDLHWADPSTLELIALLVEQGAMAPLLLLCTARPEFHAQWTPRAHHTQIMVKRLSLHNVRSIVQEVATRKVLSEETIAAVVERTAGVPLFVEELTRAVLESADAKRAGREIPVTLHDSLMARLDRLGPAREIIQIGSVIGSEFSYELLHTVHPVAGERLLSALLTLTDAELLYVQGIAPEATYLFKHALIRDTAYEALLKSRRKELHRLVARAIDEKFPSLKNARPEVLARHWTEAGEFEPAIAEWLRAGKFAEAKNAFSEALENYRQALDQLNKLPESAERDVRELELTQLAAQMLYVIKGYAAPETNEAIEHASALAEKSGNYTQLVRWALRRWLAPFNSGNSVVAAALADRALGLALREGSPSNVAMAHATQTLTRYQRGDLVGAERHFIAGLKFFDNTDFRQVPGAALWTFAQASYNAWILGRSALARERMAKTKSVANVSNPFDVAVSTASEADLCLLMREYDKAEILAERALEVSEKHQFLNEAAYSRKALGRARAELGRAAEGIELIRQGMSYLIETGLRLTVPMHAASLAEAQTRKGLFDGALTTIEQALQFNPDQLAHRPEMLRQRGEIRFRLKQLHLAEVDFRESIALAQTMSAKAWELRTTMSLARLLTNLGRSDEARTMLANIYDWFTEGFDTADLKDAKTLLDQLSRLSLKAVPEGSGR